jgi:hypothetical protein
VLKVQWRVFRFPPYLRCCESRRASMIHGKDLISMFEMIIMCQKSNEESSNCCPTSMSWHLQT